MKKLCLMTFVLSLGLWVANVTSGADCPVLVYQTDFSNNKGWQTNNAENYYLDSLAPGNPAPAYYQREIGGSEEYAYHLLPDLTPDVKWCLQYDILPVSSDWCGPARLSFTDKDMTIGGINPTYLTLMYGHDDSGYLTDLQWTDSEGNAGGVRLFHYTTGKWYENLVEWDPETSQFYVLIKEQGGNTMVDKIVTSSDPGFNGGKWPTKFTDIDRLAMSTVGDFYAPGAVGISYIDNIVVGQIPEPATVLLLGLGGLALLRRKRGYEA